MENGYFEIWQLEKYGDVLPSTTDEEIFSEDNRMPERKELEILTFQNKRYDN